MNKNYCSLVIFGSLLVLTILSSNALAIIVCEEETPMNRFATKFLVQYILEGDIIMINECECGLADHCEDKNSIELIKYRCRGNHSVCCVQQNKKTNEIEST